MDVAANLALAEKAGRAAGARLRELMSGAREIISQQGRDIKMQADRDAEAIILDMLRAESALPVLTEESGEHGDPGQGLYWAIDPLDGTLNFSRALPLCCTAVGLMQGERPVLGVIFDFNTGELFSGVAEGPGRGAWLDGRPLRVSAVAERSQAIIAAGMPSYREFTEDSLRETIGMLRAFKKTRMLGSAALSLAWIACGRVDAYAEEDIMMWDVAAGGAIVLGAGGWLEIKPGTVDRWSRKVRAGSSNYFG